MVLTVCPEKEELGTYCMKKLCCKWCGLTVLPCIAKFLHGWPVINPYRGEP